MSQTVEAIYANGIIRSLQPLDLPDQAYVRVSVEAVPDDIYNELLLQ